MGIFLKSVAASGPLTNFLKRQPHPYSKNGLRIEVAFVK